MKTIKKILLIILSASYSIISAQSDSVPHFNIAIYTLSSNSAASAQDIAFMKDKLKKAFSDLTRFTVFDADTLLADSNKRYFKVLQNNKSALKANNPHNIDYFIVADIVSVASKFEVTVDRNQKTETGNRGYVAMMFDMLDVKKEKGIYLPPMDYSSYHRNQSAAVAISFCRAAVASYFPDIVNYALPVELSIDAIEAKSKKGIAETIIVKNGEHMQISFKKGWLADDSKFEVFYFLNGTKTVVGKLKAKEFMGNELVCSVDKGNKEITKLLNENQKLYVTILDNRLDYFAKKKMTDFFKF